QIRDCRRLELGIQKRIEHETLRGFRGCASVARRGDDEERRRRDEKYAHDFSLLGLCRERCAQPGAWFSQRVNTLPCPTVLSTVTRPCWSSASSRAMARPSPVPPNSRLRD